MYLLPEVLCNLLHSSTVSYSCFVCNSTLAGCVSLTKSQLFDVTLTAFGMMMWKTSQAVNVDCMYYCTTVETFMATG